MSALHDIFLVVDSTFTVNGNVSGNLPDGIAAGDMIVVVATSGGSDLATPAGFTRRAARGGTARIDVSAARTFARDIKGH
jgi:hypothetical protein